MGTPSAFPRCWFEGNLWFAMVESAEDMRLAFKAYFGHLTPDEVLDKSRNNPHTERLEFGLRLGCSHVGKVSLRAFLEANGVDTKELTK